MGPSGLPGRSSANVARGQSDLTQANRSRPHPLEEGRSQERNSAPSRKRLQTAALVRSMPPSNCNTDRNAPPNRAPNRRARTSAGRSLRNVPSPIPAFKNSSNPIADPPMDLVGIDVPVVFHDHRELDTAGDQRPGGSSQCLTNWDRLQVGCVQAGTDIVDGRTGEGAKQHFSGSEVAIEGCPADPCCRRHVGHAGRLVVLGDHRGCSVEYGRGRPIPNLQSLCHSSQ